jgi:hypothetical protein
MACGWCCGGDIVASLIVLLEATRLARLNDGRLPNHKGSQWETRIISRVWVDRDLDLVELDSKMGSRRA